MSNMAYVSQPVKSNDLFKIFVEISNEKHNQEFTDEQEAKDFRKEVMQQLKEDGFNIRFM